LREHRIEIWNDLSRGDMVKIIGARKCGDGEEIDLKTRIINSF